MFLFMTYDCFRAVARVGDSIIGQGEEIVFDGSDKFGVRAVGEVRAANGFLEQTISAKNYACRFNIISDAAFGVTGHKKYFDCQFA